MRELGDTEHSREYWQQALEIYEQLDVPEAEQVRELLAAQETASTPFGPLTGI